MTCHSLLGSSDLVRPLMISCDTIDCSSQGLLLRSTALPGSAYRSLALQDAASYSLGLFETISSLAMHCILRFSSGVAWESRWVAFSDLSTLMEDERTLGAANADGGYTRCYQWHAKSFQAITRGLAERIHFHREVTLGVGPTSVGRLPCLERCK